MPGRLFDLCRGLPGKCDLSAGGQACQRDGRELSRRTIAVNKDLCIKCGACVNACPGEDIIVLQRTGLKMKGKETDLFKQVRDKLFTKRTSKVKEEKPGEVGLKMLGNA